jgi:hypothetical protein
MTKTEPLEHTTWQHSLSRDQTWETKQRTVRGLAKGRTDSMAPESGTQDFSRKEKSDLGEAHKTDDDHETMSLITKKNRGLSAAPALFGADETGSGATPTYVPTREDRRQIERDWIRQQTTPGARS